MIKKKQFQPAVPVMKYHQKTSNGCYMSSLVSAFHFINENRATNALVNSTEGSLVLQKEHFKNKIHFANDSMSSRRKIKGEHNLGYNLTIWKKKDDFDILNNISENVTLVQLTESQGNVNHAIIIVGHWVFD